MLDAALAASAALDPELLLDAAMLELDDHEHRDRPRAWTLIEQASRSPAHLVEAERLRRQLRRQEEDRHLADDPAAGYIV